MKCKYCGDEMAVIDEGYSCCNAHCENYDVTIKATDKATEEEFLPSCYMKMLKETKLQLVKRIMFLDKYIERRQRQKGGIGGDGG